MKVSYKKEHPGISIGPALNKRTAKKITTISFTEVDKAPVYPGCEAYNEDERRKKCTSREVQKFVAKHFNTNLTNKSDADGGITVSTGFVIDKTGNITAITSHAEEEVLELEAKRVIEKLPEMKSGRQDDTPVNVSYKLPIAFKP